MRRTTRIALLAVTALIVLLGGAAAALYLTIDAQLYRGVLESRLEQALGRDVRFGAIELSLWPTLGLRLDELEIAGTAEESEPILLTARSLRVGARLLPLLRGRLEVTSLDVDTPVMAVRRRADGSWQPARLLAEPDSVPSGPPHAGSFSVQRLRVLGGRLNLGVEGRDASSPFGLTLEDVSLLLSGLDADGPFEYALSAVLADGTGAKLRASGQGSLSGSAAAGGRFELSGLNPRRIADSLGRTLGPGLPPDLFGDAACTLSGTFEYPAGDGGLALRDVTLSGMQLELQRSAKGAWNVGPLPDGPEAPSDPSWSIERLRLDDVSLTLVDRGTGPEPARVRLTGIGLALDRLPLTEPVALELSGTLDAPAPAARFDIRGRIGPTGAELAATPVDLQAKVEALPLGVLAPFVPGIGALDTAAARLGAELSLRGRPAERIDLSGSVTLAGGSLAFDAPARGRVTLPLDLAARGNVGVEALGRRIDLRDLAVEVRGRTATPLTFRGTIDAANDPPRVDLQLLPTRIVADDLAALAAWALPDLPVSFSSPEPIDLELAVRGPVGAGTVPDLRGRAALSGFTFHHPSMLQPAEQVRATVSLEGQRVSVEGLHAVIGGSDVGGSLVLTGFVEPRLRLDLTSDRADFWELFSFIDPQASASAPGGEQAELLDRVVVEGRVAIESGSLGALSFGKLRGGIAFRDRALTLEPLELELYDGRFSGRVSQDLRATPSILSLRGNASEVSADPFLAANLDLAGVITGKAGAELALELRTGDWDTLTRSLSGAIRLRLNDGHLAQVQALRPLSRVAGVFGERTLKRLSGQLSTEGTHYRQLEMRLGFDGGRALFDELVLEASDFRLSGHGVVELATNRLDGQFAVLLSPEISAAMREEGSRAASLFWDAASRRVRVPFRLLGPATEPTASVDWEQAARGAVERRVTEELGRILDQAGITRRPETARPGKAPAPTSAETAPEKAPAPAVTDAGSPAEATSPPPLRAEIQRVRWGSTPLVPDLVLEGRVEGRELQRASLVVVDSRGREVRREDRLPAVEKHRASAADPAAWAGVPWTLTLDGKRLALVAFPLRVELTVYDTGGNSASATTEVQR